MTLTRTISMPEAIWTLVALIALIYVNRLFHRAIGNLRWLQKNKLNFAREDTARISVMIFGTFLMLVFLNFLVGVTSMMIPPRQNSVHPLVYVITIVFITKAVFIATMCYLIDRAQIRLIIKVMALEGSTNGIETR